MPDGVAIYARISLDRQDGEGVARQLADCRALAEQRGWKVTDEFVDNDLSAFRAKRRPEWDRLLEELAAGRVRAVVAYHPDRLYRKLTDLADFVEAVKTAGAEVATVNAGDIDLVSASGRMIAGMLGTAAAYESERIGERVSRAKRERAAQGRPAGGGFRAFGWADDKVTLVPAEAAALRSAALRVAAGGSIGQEARELNRAGFQTTGGRPWDAGSLRRALTYPRIAGLRAYAGEIVGKAAWPPIVDEDVWRRIVVMAEGRKRGRSPNHQSLLSALIACPKCGRRLYRNTHPRWPNYSCHPGSRQGCGGASISVPAADQAITDKVDDYLNDPSVTLWIEQGTRPIDLSSEVDAIEQKRMDLAQRWATDQITTDEYDAARGILEKRMTALGEIRRPTPTVDLAELREAWETGATALRRQVITALVKIPIGLKPGRMSNPADRLVVEFDD